MDHIDYYWLHGLGEATYHQAEAMHAFEFVQEKKKEGKVKHIGLSFHDKAELLDEILTKHSEMEYVQIQLNYLDWEDATVESKKCYEAATKIIKDSIAIPCTACRYCVDECPKNIAIPDYFAIYNNLKRFGAEQGLVAGTYYGNLTQTHEKASECLKCGKCENRCPQHLPIRGYLEDVAEALENA